MSAGCGTARRSVCALGIAGLVLALASGPFCAETAAARETPQGPFSPSREAPAMPSQGIETGPRGGDVAVESLRKDAQAVIAELQSNREGEVYAAAVEGANPDDMAIAVALVDGRAFSVGDLDTRFPIMSISKPFTYALALEQRGVGFMLERIGVSATGLPYNAVLAGAVRPTTRQNPMVNAGAIATHSYVQGATPEEKTAAVVDLYSRMADRPLARDPETPDLHPGIPDEDGRTPGR